MFTENNFKQCFCILEVGASGEKVGDILKMIVKILFKTLIHYIKLMKLWENNYDDLKFITSSRIMGKKSQVQNSQGNEIQVQNYI